MIWLLSHLENQIVFADDMEAEPASKPCPEMFVKTECIVLHRAFVFVLSYGVLSDSSVVTSLIIHDPFFSCAQGNLTVNTNSVCRGYW